jgi:coenzyme F420-dependent glucose-6-phosphate dehydrogenase
MSLKIGYKASAEQFGPRELVEFSVLAEDVGLESVMVSDHHQPWRHNGGHAPFSMSWMSAVGERTSHIVLGTSVLTATFRYNPAVVAQAFGTLGCLYPNRVLLGIGTGEALNEVAVARIQWPGFKERFARLREAVELMRRLWSEEQVTFNGQYFQTTNATVYDRPRGGVPIYVAGGGPVVSKYAGRVADGFICTSGKGMALYTDKLLPAVNDGLRASGRGSGALSRMIEIKLSCPTTAILAQLWRTRGSERPWHCRPNKSTACQIPHRWKPRPMRCPSRKWRTAGLSPATPITPWRQSGPTSKPDSITWCFMGLAMTSDAS